MLGGRGPYRLKNVTAFAQEVKQVAMGTVLNDNPEFTLHTWVKKNEELSTLLLLLLLFEIHKQDHYGHENDVMFWAYNPI